MTLYDARVVRTLDLTDLLTHIRRTRDTRPTRALGEPHWLAIALVALGGLLWTMSWIGLVIVGVLAAIL